MATELTRLWRPEPVRRLRATGPVATCPIMLPHILRLVRTGCPLQRHTVPFPSRVSRFESRLPLQHLGSDLRKTWPLMADLPRASYAFLGGAGHGVEAEQPALFRALAGDWLDRVGGWQAPA
jgi:hypothetical protein